MKATQGAGMRYMFGPLVGDVIEDGQNRLASTG